MASEFCKADYVVGWMIAPRERPQLAEQLIANTVAKQNIAPGVLLVSQSH